MTLSESRASTIGMDTFSRRFDVHGRPFKIQLWDTGGLERVASMTNNYYKFAEAALLVFSLDSLDSFHALSDHLLQILSMAESAKIFLVGNKVDITDHREVSDETVDEFLEQFPNAFTAYLKISCRTNEGVDEMFNQVVETLASTNYSFRDTFAAFTLHNRHPGAPCCSQDNGHTHLEGEEESTTATGGSCCAK